MRTCKLLVIPVLCFLAGGVSAWSLRSIWMPESPRSTATAEIQLPTESVRAHAAAELNLKYHADPMYWLVKIHRELAGNQTDQAKHDVEILMGDALLYNGRSLDMAASDDRILPPQYGMALRKMTALIKYANTPEFVLPEGFAESYKGPDHYLIPAGFNAKQYVRNVMNGTISWTLAADQMKR